MTNTIPTQKPYQSPEKHYPMGRQPGSYIGFINCAIRYFGEYRWETIDGDKYLIVANRPMRGNNTTNFIKRYGAHLP